MTITHTRPATGHVGLNVTNLDRSLEFYQSVFGFDVIHRSDEAGKRFVLLGDGGHIVLTLWEQGAGRFDGGRPGLHHLSFEVPKMDEVERALALLKSRRTKLFYPSVVAHAEGAASGGIFFEDPDGTRLEIYAASGAEAHAAPTDGPACGFF